MNRDINIFENTLRDGLYILDFLISPKEILKFVQNMLNSNFEYIEVGHGLGIGAYKKHTSGFTDEELYKELSPLLKDNKIFSFFIPMLSDIDDLKVAQEHGLYGVRIGVDTVSIPKYYSLIEKVKEMGFSVGLNIMKSYSVSNKEFINLVKGLDDIVDIIYVVDSAGCMLPNEVKNYFVELNNSCAFKNMGFHGHNNLGLAMANALVAIEEGANFIDTTLGGIGRSGGNIATEGFLSYLNKSKLLDNEENLLRVFNLSKEFRQLIEKKGRNFSIKEDDILFGHCGFHSSYEAVVREYTQKNGLDFQKFIIELSKSEKIDVENYIKNRSIT